MSGPRELGFRATPGFLFAQRRRETCGAPAADADRGAPYGPGIKEMLSSLDQRGALRVRSCPPPTVGKLCAREYSTHDELGTILKAIVTHLSPRVNESLRWRDGHLARTLDGFVVAGTTGRPRDDRREQLGLIEPPSQSARRARHHRRTGTTTPAGRVYLTERATALALTRRCR